MTCPHCFESTPPSRNFCIHCQHKVRDLRHVAVQARFKGPGSVSSRKMETFWETGDPAVFASLDALDYHPALGAL